MATDAQLERLHERIDLMNRDLGEKVSILSERVAGMTTNCPIHERRLTEVELILRGPAGNSSKPGLVDRVRDNTVAYVRIKRAVGVIGGVVLVLAGAATQPIVAKILGW